MTTAMEDQLPSPGWYPIKTRWSDMNVHPPSTGWSPTSQNIPEGSVLQTWIFAPEGSFRLWIWHLDITHKMKTGCQLPWMISYQVTITSMVPHHPKDGHSPSKICQKKMYYRFRILYIDLTHKIKTRWHPKINHISPI